MPYLTPFLVIKEEEKFPFTHNCIYSFIYNKIRINIMFSKLVFERDSETLTNSNKSV